VDFTLTQEQELLRSSARALLEGECPASLVRAHAGDPSITASLFDRHLRDWVALGEGPLVDLCLFLEEAGAVLLPGPFFASTSLFGPLLAACDHDGAAAAASGEVTGTVAWAGADGRWTTDWSFDDGVRTFALDLDAVDRVAVLLPGPSVAVVPTADLEARFVDTLDSTRRCFEVDVPSGLTGVPIEPDSLTAVWRRAVVSLAAELVGVSRWLVATTVQYAKEREQFDVPIGSFQGLQWKLVDMTLDHERALAAVYYAAMAVDADDADAVRAVHVAKAAAGNAARRGAHVGMQIHGGIGYTWEHDLHLYLRRAYSSDDLLGDSNWHHDRLGELMLG
jgi:hypothetical protein